ncbi:Msr family ABC-F type ribosomal protection protein [Shouchella patagoniensis]|uniref:Msr family ABC-F type ribosomal protection protein n=1 Tax=Shouchella patagoniensis TaxID=228576 RepID=UPI000994F2F2|nr:ABC-F type ribosomal protection protein [Shouchella patagoniensis]
MEQLTLELKDIKVSFLDKVVLNIKSLSVYQFDRIGIVGKNGEGKSTLLKVMKGEIQPIKGKVNQKVELGYFKQVDSPSSQEADYKVLSQLSVPDHYISELSGGEQTKLKLAQVFSHYYEGLLLDEPTTHLDADGVDFLIKELTYYYGSLIVVSHDRYLLDQVVTKIWEVERGKVTEYTGNYSDYVEQKELEKKQHLKKYQKYEKDRSRLLAAAGEKMKKAEKVTLANASMSKKETKTPANRMFMTKSKDTSQKAIQRSAKALEQRANQLEDVEAPEAEKVIRFQQPTTLQMHNKFPVMGEHVHLTVGKKTLLEEASFQFPLGKTIAIKGNNGSGKSTLLKHIVEQGDGIVLSPKVVFGSYCQHDYQFQRGKTVIGFMKEQSEYQESRIRSVLHAMAFTGNDLIKDVSELSGGEAIRLTLCQLFLGSYNVLILDEPTNFLDLHSMAALESFLSAYLGTVLLVSHDRAFVDRVADHVYEIDKKEMKQRY